MTANPVEDSAHVDDLRVAASSLAWTMFHFREAFADEAYAAVLPHFEALSEALTSALSSPAPALVAVTTASA